VNRTRPIASAKRSRNRTRDQSSPIFIEIIILSRGWEILEPTNPTAVQVHLVDCLVGANTTHFDRPVCG
jgi:hypothetical protein